jgi:DNA-binding NarL/FixJ family response regulator
MELGIQSPGVGLPPQLVMGPNDFNRRALPREAEVLALVGSPLSNPQIVERLHLSVRPWKAKSGL